MARIYIRTPGASLVANKSNVDVFKLSRRLKHEHRMQFDRKYRERIEEKARKTKKANFIRRVAKRLNENLPKSEVWFHEEWKKLGMFSALEQTNAIFTGKIPDLINKRHRYIIEINGSVHLRKDVQRRDKAKYRIYSRRKYKLWVVNHGDMEKLLQIAKQVRDRRRYMERWIKENPHLNVKTPKTSN